MKKRITQPFFEISSRNLLQRLTCRMSWTFFLRLLKKSLKFSEIFSKTFFWKKCHIFSFLQMFKIRDSSFVAPSMLRHIMPKNWSWLKNCARDNDSRRTLFCIKIDRTWRHSDVISGRPMIGTKSCFVRMCKIDVPEGTESLVPISLFVWKILRKNERGF